MQKRYIQWGIFLVTAALVVDFAMAGGVRETALKADPEGIGAGGALSVTVRDREMTTRGEPEKEITVNATRLKPNSVYTVWLVNEIPKKEREALGEAGSFFKSDERGDGNYTAVISDAELSRWEKLEIDRHPDGNPQNTKDAETVLKANLR